MQVHVMIGNSDDKLGQMEWSEYQNKLRGICLHLSNSIQGVWFSLPDSVYQNMCVAMEMNYANYPLLKEQLKELAKTFKQKTIAILMGDVNFIGNN